MSYNEYDKNKQNPNQQQKDKGQGTQRQQTPPYSKERGKDEHKR